jgi:hypothetical protein
MSRKRLKKAVKKVSSVGVRRVPSAFDDDTFVEIGILKGVFLWPLFNFRDNCPSGPENEFVDVDSFSDAAPEVHKETVPAAANESIIAADVAAPLRPPLLLKPLLLMSLNPLSLGTKPPPNSPSNLSSRYKAGRILLNMFLVEVREVVPEDQAPSPSLAAFNKSFGTSHRGKLLSVGFETTGVGSKISKILTLWKSPMAVNESGGESSGQPEGAAQESEKGPHPTPEATPSSRGQASSGSAKQVTMQHFSKQGSFLFTIFRVFSDFRISN